MFSVYCTSKWIHRAWIFGWVVQFHPSFVKCLIGLEVFMWPLSCGAYMGDAGWSLVCFKLFFIFFASPLCFPHSPLVSLISSIPHIRKHILFDKSKEGFRALPGLNIFFLLFFIFHAYLLSNPNMANFCILSIFSSLFHNENGFLPAFILEPAMKSEEML